MKDDNAKEKWCPMTSGAFSAKCVADDCMSWRWTNKDSGFCGLAGPLVCTAGSGIIRPADISEKENEIVGRFVNFECEKNEKAESPSETVAEAFFKFYSGSNPSISRKRFGQIMTKNHCKSVKRGGKYWYQGIKLA